MDLQQQLELQQQELMSPKTPADTDTNTETNSIDNQGPQIISSFSTQSTIPPEPKTEVISIKTLVWKSCRIKYGIDGTLYPVSKSCTAIYNRLQLVSKESPKITYNIKKAVTKDWEQRISNLQKLKTYVEVVDSLEIVG